MKTYACIWYGVIGCVVAKSKVDAIRQMRIKFPKKSYPSSDKYMAEHYVKEIFRDEYGDHFYIGSPRSSRVVRNSLVPKDAPVTQMNRVLRKDQKYNERGVITRYDENGNLTMTMNFDLTRFD